MRSLHTHLWQAALTMCRADRRFPVFMKPALAVMCLYSVITDATTNAPLSLVAIVLHILLIIEFAATLRTQLRESKQT